MAAADYRLCDLCTCKTFYDANVDYEPTPQGHRLWPAMRPDRVGDWAVICDECAKTHEVIVRPIEPSKKGAGA